MTLLLSGAQILSPDGKCQSFDHKANGYSRGEGIAVTILKPLDSALRDNDTIRAIIPATASNQDGRTPGLSSPSVMAQEELIRTAYRQGGLDMSCTGYVEAHGTGTPVGDPIEMAAIVKTIGSKRTSKVFVGSVKTNIGHLEGAAGIAGIIKAALVVERGLIPPNLWFEKLNPRILLNKNVEVRLRKASKSPLFNQLATN
jgi:acyl transferase domain-containing protein